MFRFELVGGFELAIFFPVSQEALAIVFADFTDYALRDAKAD